MALKLLGNLEVCAFDTVFSSYSNVIEMIILFNKVYKLDKLGFYKTNLNSLNFNQALICELYA